LSLAPTLAPACRRRTPLARLAPLDGPTLRRMLRFALVTGADLLTLRPGCRPLLDGLGGPREVRFRQLAGDDTRAACALLFAALRPYPGVRDARAEGARVLGWLVHWPDEALFEVRTAPAPGGPEIAVDIVRPLAEAPDGGAPPR
jgi:hypothetical protein